MESRETQVASSPGRRRWYQFSLRTLLVVMLLASIGMSWFAVKMQQARSRRELVREIAESGGSVDYEYETNGTLAVGEPLGPKWLREMLGDDLFASGVRVHAGGRADEVLLERAFAMHGLTMLFLSGSRTTDAHVGQLARADKLEYLTLKRTKVTNACLIHLKGLTTLRCLDLDNCQITDEGLTHIRELKQLESLSLEFTKITDQGLLDLKEMTQLRSLSLFGTKVTEAGVQKLQKALPNCKIVDSISRPRTYWPKPTAPGTPASPIPFRPGAKRPNLALNCLPEIQTIEHRGKATPTPPWSPSSRFPGQAARRSAAHRCSEEGALPAPSSRPSVTWGLFGVSREVLLGMCTDVWYNAAWEGMDMKIQGSMVVVAGQSAQAMAQRASPPLVI